MRREADLVVVGGGLVALMATAAAVEAGMRVIHYRIADRPPLPDHEWLHSGLLLDTDLPTARLVRVWGRNMLRTFGIETSSEAGIFIAQNGESASRLQMAAGRLAVPIQELRPTETARMAGLHFSQSRSYIVPDTLFDKRALTKVAEGCCVSGGASMVELSPSDSIVLLPCDRAAGGILVQTARELAESAFTVLADGAMIPSLVEPLGIKHPLAVYRSPVIAMPGPDGLRAGLLVDLDRGLSYVRHEGAAPSYPLYTIAHGGWGAANNGARPPADLLPPDMWPSRPRPTERIVAVAREVQWSVVGGQWTGASGQGSAGSRQAPVVNGRESVAAGQGSTEVLPLIHQFKNEGFPGLVGVVSNIANLALWTARQIMKVIGKLDAGTLER